MRFILTVIFLRRLRRRAPELFDSSLAAATVRAILEEEAAP